MVGEWHSAVMCTIQGHVNRYVDMQGHVKTGTCKHRVM